MKISVSIVHYKVADELYKAIESLNKALQNIDSEIIVVDNHSEDDSEKIITSQFPNVIWIQNQENIGFGKAHNQAIKKAKGEFIAIVNPDVVVPSYIFSDLLQFSTNTPSMGIVGLRMEDEKGAFLAESKRNPPSLWNAFEKQLGIRILPPSQSYYAQQLQEFDIGKVAVLSGAFMWMKKSVFEDLQGFDPQFFMYAEDIDLSIRSLEHGYENSYLGSLSIKHIKGASAQKNPDSRKHFYHTMLQYIDKHEKSPFLKIISKILVRLSYWKEKNM